MAVHFTSQEFKNRKEKALKNMSEANIDALLMFPEEYGQKMYSFFKKNLGN